MLYVRIFCVGLTIFVTSTGANAQIIDETYTPPAPLSGAVSGSVNFDLDLFSSLNYSTNARASSNLPGGLEEEAQSGFVLINGASVSASASIAPGFTAFAALSGFHANIFDNSDLNFIGVVATAGIAAAPSSHVSLFAYGTCVAELDESGFERFYEWCGPTAGLNLRTAPRNRTHLEFGARGTLALGSEQYLANFKEAAAHLRFATGGPLRFAIEPNGFVRQYRMPDGLPAPFDETRVDYQGAVEVSLTYSAGGFELGLFAEPSVRWSNYAQYRFWNLRVGPQIRARF